MNHDVTAYGALPRPHRLLGQQFLHLLRSICPADGRGLFALAADWWTRACVTMGMGMLVLLHVAKPFREVFETGRTVNRIDGAWADRLLSAGRV